jgi:hypothetical protein
MLLKPLTRIRSAAFTGIAQINITAHRTAKSNNRQDAAKTSAYNLFSQRLDKGASIAYTYVA